jgi:Domain of Unknown Function (DUF1080)
VRMMMVFVKNRPGTAGNSTSFLNSAKNGGRIIPPSVFGHIELLLATPWLLLFAVAAQLAIAGNPAAAQEAIEFPPGVDLPLVEAEVAAGWIALFDGESLFGWRNESNANWQVIDGCIFADEGQTGLLRTGSQFDNYRLRVEFAAGPDTDSGVVVRTSPRPADPASDCYEVNIAPESNEFPTGSIVARSRVESGSETTHHPDGFRWLEIVCLNDRIEVRLDGELLTDYRDEKPLGRGYVGLQKNTGPVRFRRVLLQPLFNDEANTPDLASWARSGDVVVEPDANGAVCLKSGPGQIESPDLYADFVMQLECKVAAKVNSGVFFRCIPGETQNGYESQIDNAWAGDRSAPSNGGTGAIFRRTEARRVVAEDQKWFAKTIVATGPHIAVWVNGYQVTEWVDGRKEDANPRRGRRLAAGSVLFQAHDVSMEASFRNFRISELAPRGK